MKERDIYLIIIGCLIIINISTIVMFSFNLFDVINQDFIGSLLGAAISGLFAIYVFRKGQKQKELNDFQKTKENFNKSYILIKKWGEAGRSFIYDSVETVGNDDFNKIQQFSFGLQESIKRLEQINDDYIPEKVYESFITLKGVMEQFSSFLSAYHSNLQVLKGKMDFQVTPKNPLLKAQLLEIIVIKNDYYNDLILTLLNDLEEYYKEINK